MSFLCIRLNVSGTTKNRLFQKKKLCQILLDPQKDSIFCVFLSRDKINWKLSLPKASGFFVGRRLQKIFFIFYHAHKNRPHKTANCFGGFKNDFFLRETRKIKNVFYERFTGITEHTSSTISKTNGNVVSLKINSSANSLTHSLTAHHLSPSAYCGQV